MNIPQSTLAPFGVIGIPTVAAKKNIVETIFDKFYTLADAFSTVEKAVLRFEHLIDENLAELGLDYITISIDDDVRCPTTGKLLSRKYTVNWHPPHGRGYIKQYRFGWHMAAHQALPKNNNRTYDASGRV